LKIEEALTAQSFGGADGPPGRQKRAEFSAAEGSPAVRIISRTQRDWELTPGNVDGIFQKIILPELRAQHDPRLLEILGRENQARG
jgi:hypothetical protein